MRHTTQRQDEIEECPMCGCQRELHTLRRKFARSKEQLEALARTVMSDMGNKREPLSIEQINTLVGDVYRRCGNMKPTPEIIVRAIELAHGIGYGSKK